MNENKGSRDKEKREIDLLLEQNGTMHPIEIKKTARPDKSMLKNVALAKDVDARASVDGMNFVLKIKKICFTFAVKYFIINFVIIYRDCRFVCENPECKRCLWL